MGRTSKNRSHIISIASYLFWVRGYEAVGVNDICEKADINKGTLYHFFKTKQDVALEVIKINQEKVLFFIDQTKGKPGVQRVLAYFDMMMGAQMDECNVTDKFAGCPFGNLSAEMAGKSSAIRDAVNIFFGKMIEFISEALGDSSTKKNTKVLATEIFTYWQGALLMSKTANSMKPLSKARTYTKNIFSSLT